MKRLHLLCMLVILSLASFNLRARVTTSEITGIVLTEEGEPMIAANVVATHVPSGSVYGTITRDDGKFTIPNVRIGGPYTVEASYLGYRNQSHSDIFLVLGEKTTLDFALEAEGITTETIVVTAEEDPIMNRDRTGASTNIKSEQIAILPTISRNASGVYRLSPYADGNSFGGRNDQYNNFTLDGSIFNNPFGLDAATPGGQTDAQAVSLDAIDQIQVALAPFDVTNAGFTGALINSVTRSGTNEFHGTVFGFFRNQDLTGSKVKGNDIFVPDLKHTQFGASIGGPIVQNKLFFFANFEMQRRGDLGSNFVAKRPGLEGGNVSRVEASDLDLVSQTLFDRFGYQTGPYEDFLHHTDNEKGIIKLDWNINDWHKLSAKWNFLNATKGKPRHPLAFGSSEPDAVTLQMHNSGYEIQNKIQSGIIELRSLFSNKYANNLQVGFTAFRDSRNPFSEPFPSTKISRKVITTFVVIYTPASN